MVRPILGPFCRGGSTEGGEPFAPRARRKEAGEAQGDRASDGAEVPNHQVTRLGAQVCNFTVPRGLPEHLPPFPPPQLRRVVYSGPSSRTLRRAGQTLAVSAAPC